MKFSPGNRLQTTIAAISFVLIAIFSAELNGVETGTLFPDKVIVKKVITNIEGENIQVGGYTDSLLLLIHNGDTLLAGIDYQYLDGKVLLKHPLTASDTTVLILFRDYPLLGRQFFLRKLQSSNERRQPSTQPVEPLSTVLPRSSKLKIRGTKSFSADVSDHNNANLSQGLMMTIAGELGHGIRLKGSFSDRGLRKNRLVTRRFSELENIYLEAESDHLRGRFGNFTIKEKRFSYLGYTRNVQGLEVGYKTNSHDIGVSLSVPPGSFATNYFTIQDGNYGPYLLTGSKGESGIAVIENSETLWLNGRKLTRGRDQDYYVNYIRGELFFTGRIVTDNKDRVRIDFEYQKTEYRKTFTTGTYSNKLGDGRLRIDLGVASLFNSGDDPIEFSLSTEDIAALANAGDDPDLAVVPGAEYVGVGAGDYQLVQDSVAGEIYEYVGDNNGAYRVTFTKSDSGDYLYLGAGRYQYVGKGQGNYLPVKTIPLPEGIAIADLKGQYKVSDGFVATAEGGISSYDRNRFSSLDDQDNVRFAGNLGLSLGSGSDQIRGSLAAQFLPAGFARLSRLDYVDENYLWQRTTDQTGDRQRYLGNLTARLTNHDSTHLELGHTREVGGLTASRVGISTEVSELAKSIVRVRLFHTKSTENNRENRLFGLQPEIVSRILPAQLTLQGDYDNHQTTVGQAQTISDSKRSVHLSAGFKGMEIGVRRRENWRKETNWLMLNRKSTLNLQADQPLPNRGQLAISALLNRFKSSGLEETYQTGSIDLRAPGIFQFVDLNSRFRLNRRGRSQTSETYMKVDQGEGDYILVDSVYIPDSHGDYIRLTEQVGIIEPTIEAEKRVDVSFKLHPLLHSPITKGVTLRYEINSREIGSQNRDFQAQWFLPQKSYFNDDLRFNYRRQEYQLKRFDSKAGCKVEFTYKRRAESNKLDIDRSTSRWSEQGRLLWNQRIRQNNIIESKGIFENSREQQEKRYQLNIHRRKFSVRGQHYQGRWEFTLFTEVSREKADSLRLIAYIFKLRPQVSYNLGAIGRIELSSFLFHVAESEDREILIQMADGFPRGINYGGNLRIDIKIASNFELKLLGRGEIRDGEKNRYYLRSELVSRFQ